MGCRESVRGYRGLKLPPLLLIGDSDSVRPIGEDLILESGGCYRGRLGALMEELVLVKINK